MKRIYPDEWPQGNCRAHDAAMRLNDAIKNWIEGSELVGGWIGDDLLEVQFTCDEDIGPEAQASLQCLTNENLIVGVMVITKVLNNDGVWKVIAVTGHKAYQEAKKTWQTVAELSQILGVPPDYIVEHVQQLVVQRDKLKAQLAALEQGPSIAALLTGATELYGVRLILQEFPGVAPKQMRATINQLCKENAKVCVMLVNQSETGTVIVAGLSSDLVGDLSASIWVQRVAEIADGSGGGSDCIAQGGGPKTDVLPAVFAQAHHHYIAMISSLIGHVI